jgi:hypothetical protein
MPGEMEILFSLAGRIHVLLRRETNRIVDVEWLLADGHYAKEVLRLATATDSAELHKLVVRIEAVHPLLPKIEQPIVQPPVSNTPKYLCTLR